MKKFIKKALNWLTGFSLFVLFVLFTFSVVLLSTVFNPNYLLKKYQEINYYEILKSELLEVYRSYGSSFGVPDGFTESEVIDSARLYSDVSASVTTAYGGELYSPDRASLEEDLSKRLYDYIDRNDLSYERMDSEAVSEYAARCVDEYIKKIRGPFESVIAENFKTGKTAMIVLMCSCVVAIVAAMIWTKKRLEWKHRLLERIAHASFATAIICFLIWYIFDYYRIVKRIAVSTRSLYIIIVSWCSDIYGCFIFISIGFLVIGLLMTMFYYITRRILSKRTGKLVNDAVMHF